MSKVIILGCRHGGLAVMRSLGPRGVYVIGLTYDPTDFGLRSRFLDEWHVCPHPREEEALVDFLMAHGEAWDGALLYETNDYYLTAISKHKNKLGQHFRIIAPEWELTQQFLEKDLTYQLADACDVPRPGFYRPQSMDELETLAPEIQFPVLVKPVLSHKFVQVFKEKLFVCTTMEGVRTHFGRALDARLPVILSEIIPGTDYHTFERVDMYVNTQGEICVEYCNVKLRQAPPMFGIMRVGRSIRPVDDLKDYGRRLMQQSNFRGYANAEFKRDPRDNKLKLIEINIRCPSVMGMAMAAGVDFPWLIYQDLVLGQQAQITEYNHDTHFIDISLDFAHYIRHDKNKSLSIFIKPYLARHKTFAALSLKDPKPFIGHTLDKVKKLKLDRRNKHV